MYIYLCSGFRILSRLVECQGLSWRRTWFQCHQLKIDQKTHFVKHRKQFFVLVLVNGRILKKFYGKESTA